MNDYYCSFVEYAKPSLKMSSSQSTTDIKNLQAKHELLCVFNYVLQSIVCQLHPFLPFETEEINCHLSTKSLLTSDYFTSHSELRVKQIDKSLIEQVEKNLCLVHDVRGLQKLCGDLSKSKDTHLDHCILLLNQGIPTPSPAMLEIVSRLTKLNITVSYEILEESQIHIPSQIPGISVMFPIPAERKSGVMKAIQDNVRGLEKKLAQSERKLASIERNLKNPLFLERASPEVCEREKNDLEKYTNNCSVLRKNVAELLEIMKQN